MTLLNDRNGRAWIDPDKATVSALKDICHGFGVRSGRLEIQAGCDIRKVLQEVWHVKRFTMLALTGIALTGCGGDATGSSGDRPTYAITGFVLDSLTGAAPDSATLEIEGEVIPLSGAGAFSAEVDSGRITVDVIVPGYVAYHQEVPVSGAGPIDFRLRRTRPAILLMSVTTNSFLGRLFDAQGASTIDLVESEVMIKNGSTEDFSGFQSTSPVNSFQLDATVLDSGSYDYVDWLLYDAEGNRAKFRCDPTCLERQDW